MPYQRSYPQTVTLPRSFEPNRRLPALFYVALFGAYSNLARQPRPYVKRSKGENLRRYRRQVRADEHFSAAGQLLFVANVPGTSDRVGASRRRSLWRGSRSDAWKSSLSAP